MKKHFHLIGICGTAMASLAGMLKSRGHRVTGSDNQFYPPMGSLLASLEIPVFEGFRPENVANPDMVVVGNAIARGNPELESVLDRKLPYASLPEILRRQFLKGKESVVIAGTHGKTTTTSMVAWILEKSGMEPSFLIGGIAENFSSSYQVAEGRHFVLEGDEYDTAYFDKRPKFLHYFPDLLLISSIEYDHADIYPDLDAIVLQFRRLVHCIASRGKVVAAGGAPAVREAVSRAFCPVEFYGFEPSCHWRASEITEEERGSRFLVSFRQAPLGEFRIPLPGAFNVMNALGAIAVATAAGASPDSISAALAQFRGPLRRLEEVFSENGILLIDDFAHHPTAVRESLNALRARYGKRRIWAIFEPRSWSCRKNIHQDVFPEAFSPADVTILADVYQKESIPENERLSPERIIAKMLAAGREAYFIPEPDGIVEFLAGKTRPGDVLCTMSNGSFGNIQQKLRDMLLSIQGEMD